MKPSAIVSEVAEVKMKELSRWKSTNALRIEALEGLKNHYHELAERGAEAIKTLSSEREANAILTAEVDALRARVAELEKERDYYASEDEKLLNEIGRLLDDVKYAGSYAEGVRVLLAKVSELEKDAARYQTVRSWFLEVSWNRSYDFGFTCPEDVDAEIDAMIKDENGEIS
jgi:predicted nuclease with TOPRIM domain